MKRRFSRASVLVLAALAAVLIAPAGNAAAATEGWDQNIPIFLLADDSLGLTVIDGQVVLDEIDTEPAGRWNVTETDPDNYYTNHTYTNVDTGQCLAAPSIIDGLQLKMVPCDPADRQQQWNWSADRLFNDYTGECMHTEAFTAGARLYQDDCGHRDSHTEFSDELRVRLDAVSGDGQVLAQRQTGDPLVVRITDEQGNPLEGFHVKFDLRGRYCCEPGNSLSSPVEFADGGLKADLISDAEGLVSTPAVTATTGETGEFYADLSPRLKLYTDLYVVGSDTMSGVVE